MPDYSASRSSSFPAPPSRNASPNDRSAEAPQSRLVVQSYWPAIVDAYVLEPGIAGSNVSTPHAAVMNTVTDLTVIMCVLLDDWTPTADQTIVSKHTSAAAGSWSSQVASSGPAGILRAGADVAGVFGNASMTVSVQSVTKVVDGRVIWLKQERTSSSGQVDFFYSNDPPSTAPSAVAWTSLQPNRAGPSLALDDSPTVDVHVGGHNGGATAPMAGKVFRATAYKGIGTAGTQMFDMRPADWVSGTTWVSSTTGETWTINGTATVVPAVGGGQVLPAQVATLTLTAVPGGVTPGSAALPAQIATLTLTAVPGSVTPGTANLPAQIALLTLTAVPGAVTPGTAPLPSQVATLTLTATPGSVTPGAAVLPSQVALLTLTAVPGSVTPGNVNLASQVATITLTAVPGSVVATPPEQVLPAQIATLTLTAVPGGVVGGTAALASQTATLALTAVPGGVVGGTALLPSQVALLTLTATPGHVVAATSQVLPSQVALLTLTAMPGRVIGKRVYHGGARQRGQIPRPYKTPKPQRMRVEYGPNGEMYLLPVDGDPETKIDNPLPPDIDLPIVPVVQDPFTLVSDDELLLLLC